MKLKHLLLLALCLHLAASACVYWAGRARAWPAVFDADGVASFASDGRRYRIEIGASERTLREEGFAAWLRAQAPTHVKLYALSYALFGPVLGRTILSAAPLNALYYLATLLLVFAIGRELYGAEAGLLAAAVFALVLPSYLLHATQLLRDPLFVVLMLGFVLAALKLIVNTYALGKALLVGALGGAAAAALWLVRSPTSWVVVFLICLALLLRAARRAGAGEALKANAAGLALMLGLAVGATYLMKPYRSPREKWSPAGAEVSRDAAPDLASGAASAGQTSAEPPGLDEGRRRPVDLPARLVTRVRHTRAMFVEQYPGAGSNIDTDVEFAGLSDVAAYLPRAFLIGMCAPFPGMWLRSGTQVGSAGRILSAAETLLLYAAELLALYGLWRRRREPGVWFVASAALAGVTALGLTVVNVGTLYRLRYVFCALFVVMAADTISRVGALRSKTVNMPARDETGTSEA